MTYRAIVVGLGSIGKRHARLLRERQDMAVEVCEPQPEILADAMRQIGDLPSHDGYASALASNPDLVVIATPHALHADQTVAALDAGVHVLCEKPMSDTGADARRMADAARRSAAVLSIGFMLHFNPGLQRVKALIDTGALGQILHVHARVGSYVTLVNSLSRYQAALEGALLLDYAHQPDVLAWWLGREPRGAYVVGGQAGAVEHRSNPNFLACTLDYDEPLIATIHLNYVQMPERHEYEVVGDAGWALFDFNAGSLRIGNRSDRSLVEETFGTERDAMYRAEHQAFVDAVEGRRAPESAADDSMVSMRIIAAALRSLQSGQREATAV